MTDITQTHEFMALYQSLYQNLHSTWNKDERSPSAESIAVMNHLILSGPLTVTEAALHFNRAQSAMSELFDRLQLNGYVERMKDSRDKRKTLVWLTDLGRETYARTQEVLDRELLHESLQMLPLAHRSNLLETMQQLIIASQKVVSKRRTKNESM